MFHCLFWRWHSANIKRPSELIPIKHEEYANIDSDHYQTRQKKKAHEG